MKKNPVLILSALAATSIAANGALVWTASTDDNTHLINGVAGGPAASFLQENGAINPLPGNVNSSSSANAGGTPTPPAGQERPDNDYYFAGNYSVPAPNYPAYPPAGIVASDELAAERAFAAADNSLRYHFNLPAGGNPLDQYTVTFDANNLHIDAALNPDPRYGVEVYFNNVLIAPQVIIRPANLDFNYTTAAFTLGSVGGVAGPGFDNIVELRGINYNGAGGGNWMGVDYVQLDVTPVPEPGSAAMVLIGALGCSVFFRRRR